MKEIQKIYTKIINKNFDPYQDKTIVLESEFEFDLNDFDGKTIDESIGILQELKSKINHNKNIAVWGTEGRGYYETPIATLRIYRAETDKEFNTRQKNYKRK